jgi:hypothetical protein
MKKNPFLIGYATVTAVGAAALGFLLYSGYSHYTEVRETYEGKARKFVSLKNRVPFPSAENNAAYAELTAEYKSAYEKLVAQINEMQEPLEQISPSAFQDKLRAMVSEVQASAAANSVELDPAFYLGFDRYQAELPSDQAAAPLYRQLKAIRLVIDQLIEAKVRRIVSIRRDLLPQEGGAASTEPEPRPGGNQQPSGGRSQSAPSRSIVSAAPFEVVFVADQGKARQSLNAIARASQFLVIRALNIENSATTGPSREAPPETASNSSTPPPSSSPGDELASLLGTNTTSNEPSAAAPTSTLRVLVGLETLTVGARIEMLTFNLADSKE